MLPRLGRKEQPIREREHVSYTFVVLVYFLISIWKQSKNTLGVVSWAPPLPLPSLKQIPWPVYSFQDDFLLRALKLRTNSISQRTRKSEGMSQLNYSMFEITGSIFKAKYFDFPAFDWGNIWFSWKTSCPAKAICGKNVLKPRPVPSLFSFFNEYLKNFW